MEDKKTTNPVVGEGQTPEADGEAAAAKNTMEAKIFSQSDVNRILNRRLAEERNKAETLFAQKEEALARKELQCEAAETLRQRKLPPALAKLLDFENREKCEASLDAIEADFQAAVRAGVLETLRGNTPPKDGAEERDPGAAVRGAMGLR